MFKEAWVLTIMYSSMLSFQQFKHHKSRQMWHKWRWIWEVLQGRSFQPWEQILLMQGSFLKFMFFKTRFYTSQGLIDLKNEGKKVSISTTIWLSTATGAGAQGAVETLTWWADDEQVILIAEAEQVWMMVKGSKLSRRRRRLNTKVQSLFKQKLYFLVCLCLLKSNLFCIYVYMYFFLKSPCTAWCKPNNIFILKRMMSSDES